MHVTSLSREEFNTEIALQTGWHQRSQSSWWKHDIKDLLRPQPPPYLSDINLVWELIEEMQLVRVVELTIATFEDGETLFKCELSGDAEFPASDIKLAVCQAYLYLKKDIYAELE